MKKTYLLALVSFLLVIESAGRLQGKVSSSAAVLTTNYSVRFYGSGTNDWDRIKIPVDNPQTSVDVGQDFTIEFWLKADPNDNSLGTVWPGGDGWILGHIIFDRDIWGAGDYGDFGISIGKNISKDPSGNLRFIGFGVDKGGLGNAIVGNTNVADLQWHHVAATRSGTSGDLRIFIDGRLDAELLPSSPRPTGDLSYRDGRSGYPNDPFLVIGAEKHDVDPSSYPSYSGLIDEIRVSDVVRYTSNFSPPNVELVSDAHTMALYHLNEGSGTQIIDDSSFDTDGVYKPIAGDSRPVWVTDNPFSYRLPVVHGSDFSGDEKADIAVWRPSEGTWYIKDILTQNWGIPGDIPVNGDYNGNNVTDIAIWRPASGTWFVKDFATFQWGAAGDIPVPGKYSVNSNTDVAVWRPSSGIWYIKDIATYQWGTAGDIPVPGDYNGDGVTEAAVWRPSTGTWFIKDGGSYQWGIAGDIPVPGDYNGDGTCEIAVWRPANGTWYIWNVGSFQWGMNGDIPAPGDFAGDAAIELSVWRPAEGRWYIFNDPASYKWGAWGDIPLVR